MTLHEWIKAERQAGRHWTQAKIAARLGVHPVTLNRVMMGKRETRIGLARQIFTLTGGAVGLTDWPVLFQGGGGKPHDYTR